VLPNGAIIPKNYSETMDEHLFLKGQRVISPAGEGEVVDAIGDKIVVKLDKGEMQTFPSGELTDNNNAG
jgi:hypothetical protein